jgi:hypothetical protein
MPLVPVLSVRRCRARAVFVALSPAWAPQHLR